MKKLLIVAVGVLVVGHLCASSVDNVVAQQRPGTGIVDIYYDLIANEGGATDVSISLDGSDGNIIMKTLSGDVGRVAPGPTRHIVWNAQADNPEKVVADVRVVVSAQRMESPINPGMKKISGTFVCSYKSYSYYGMDGWRSYISESASRKVETPFYIDRAPVSGALWNKVADWAVKHGYRFRYTYSSSASVVYPHTEDAWVWCNARSAMEGLPKCHPRREGSHNDYSYDAKDYHMVYPTANGGYRLPSLHEMMMAFCAGVGSTSEGFAYWYNTGMDNIGYVRKLSSGSADYELCLASSTYRMPLYCVRDQKSGYPLVETFPPNYSPAFDIDTRKVSSEFPKDFKIINVHSKYCEGEYGKGHASLFLSGVPCEIAFSVEVSGGDLSYIHVEAGGNVYFNEEEFKLDVGSLAPGDSVVVRAVSADGRWSQPYRLNFDIASQNGRRFIVAETSSESDALGSIVYRTTAFETRHLFDELRDGVQFGVIPTPSTPFEALNSVAISLDVDIYQALDSSDGIMRDIVMLGGGYQKDDGAKPKGKKVKFINWGPIGIDAQVGRESNQTWDKSNLTWKPARGATLLDVDVSKPILAARWSIVYMHVDMQGNLHLKLPDEGGWSVDTDKLLGLSGTLGAGIPMVANINGSLTGGMFAKFGSIYNPFWSEAGFVVKLNGEANFLVWKRPLGEVTLWKHYFIGGSETDVIIDPNRLLDATMEEMALSDSAPSNLVSRGYLEDFIGQGQGASETCKWPGIPSAVTNLYPRVYTAIELGKNGMPSPSPQLPGDTPSPHGFSSGADDVPHMKPPPKIAVLTDSAERSARKRSTVVTISDITNTTFIAEDAVWNDGTPDYCPVSALATNGCTVLAWMNEKGGCSDDISLAEMMSSMEIAVAIWDCESGSWECANLTDDAAYNRSPVLKAATNGTFAVAWIRNAYTNYMGSSTQPNQICFARYKDGSWSSEEVVASVGRVRKIDLAYDGVRAAIAFFEEEGPADDAKQRLCLVTSYGQIWTPCRTVLESVSSGGSVYSYFDENGEIRLVWNEEGSVKTGTFTADEPVCETINTGSRQVCGDFAFARARSGKMALVWLEQTDAGNPASELVTMMYYPQSTAWTVPSNLTADGGSKSEISAAFNDAGDLEVLYSTPNTVTNTQGFLETISSGFVKATRRHGGDIAVLLDDVSFSTNVLHSGEPVDVFFKVRNIGDEAVSNIMVRVFEYNTSQSRTLEPLYLSGLKEGQTATLSGRYMRINELDCGQVVEMKIDSFMPEELSTDMEIVFSVSATGDAMTLNNSAWWSYDGTGAEVMLMKPQAAADECSRDIRHVSVELENAGETPVPLGTRVTFRRGDKDGSILASKTVGRLNPGKDGVQVVGFAWDVSGIEPVGNSEVVHVTVELPSESMGTNHIFETEINLDVTPMHITPLTTYSLTYDANGGEGEMPSESVFYEKWGALTLNAFARPGYAFAGWSYSPTGKVEFADGAIRRNVSMFSKDSATLYASWIKLAEETGSTEVPVPFAWLGTYFPEATNSTDNFEQQMANFEEIANRRTGKRDSAGNPLSVWHDYVSGTDPTNTDSIFTAEIHMEGTEPVIKWKPDSPELRATRIYRTLGKMQLGNDVDWVDVTDKDKSQYKFFKVTVDMPDAK